MDNKRDVVFTKGLRFFAPNDKAPDFVKANVKLDLKEFFDFVSSDEIKAHYKEYTPKGTTKKIKQLPLQLLESKDGGFYFTVDTFVPNGSGSSPTPVAVEAEAEDLPF
mgnify:CR=1 FL=1|jgi:3-polyprenyl-4-hydroxybenzoate decarboxylase